MDLLVSDASISSGRVDKGYDGAIESERAAFDQEVQPDEEALRDYLSGMKFPFLSNLG